MLSDQALAACAKAKRKRNKNDGFCVLGFVFLCRSLLAAFVRWHAAISLLYIFMRLLSKNKMISEAALLPVGFAID